MKSYSGSSWEDWDDEGTQFNGSGYYRNAFPVLRHVASLTTEWVWRVRPYRFYFEAIDRRRYHIYRHLVNRYVGPTTSQYTHYLHGTRFWFVRTVDGPIRRSV